MSFLKVIIKSMTKINKNKHIKFWQESAERSWNAALGLFKLKHYDACLFFCHLALEKLLKGLVVKQTSEIAPYIHDLERLAKLADLILSETQIQILRIITKFNVAGRYSDIKYAFYKKCTKGYTQKYLRISQKIILWLKREYQKK